MKCASCNRKLDSRSFCIDKKEIYCTVCLKKNRLAGQDTPKIHPDTTVIATAEGEKGCPRYDYNSKRSGGKLVFRINIKPNVLITKRFYEYILFAGAVELSLKLKN